MSKMSRKIKDLRTVLGLDQTEFGKKMADTKAGLPPVPQPTVSKWELDKQLPDTDHMRRLAKLAGVPMHEWLDVPPVGQSHPVRGKRIPIVGAVAAGAWREAVAYPEEDQEYVEAQLPSSYRNLEIQAFDVEGTSMNKVYPDGTLVYVASTASYRAPESGDRVLVVRTNRDGLVEVSLKEYEIDETGKRWLWPRSYDPMHQAPLDYLSRSEGDVTISGIVVAALVIEKGRMLPASKKVRKARAN